LPVQLCLIWGSAISKLLNKVSTNGLLGRTLCGPAWPVQGEEHSKEALHHQKTRKDTYLNRNGLRHKIEISVVHKRGISQKCQWLSLLKLTQKMWLGTHSPILLLNFCIPYPKLYFPPCLQESTKCSKYQIQYSTSCC